MKETTKSKIKMMLESYFNIPLQFQKNHFIHSNKEDTIVLYEWFDGSAYRYSSEIFDHTQQKTLEESIQEIKKQFTIVEISEESYFYRDEVLALKKPSELHLQELSHHHEEHLNDLKKSCHPNEIQAADISVQDEYVVGAYVDEKIASAAGILVLYGAYDIGILTLPRFRVKGIGSIVVNACANWIIEQGHLCQYRCENRNQGSYRTAKKLKFEKGIRACVIKIKV